RLATRGVDRGREPIADQGEARVVEDALRRARRVLRTRREGRGARQNRNDDGPPQPDLLRSERTYERPKSLETAAARQISTSGAREVGVEPSGGVDEGARPRGLERGAGEGAPEDRRGVHAGRAAGLHVVGAVADEDRA